MRTDEFRVLGVARQCAQAASAARCRGNRFRIRLRKVAWPREELEAKLAALRAHGAPNYFGPQRFGRDGFNLDRVAEWLQSGKRPAGRAERGFALSAARSLIFNAVLARRVQSAGTGRGSQPGDLASLDGSGSHFRVDAVDDGARAAFACVRHPPLGSAVGTGRAGDARAASLETELEVAREFARSPSCSQQEGLEQERRALRCAVRDLSMESEAAALTLELHASAGASSRRRCCARFASSPSRHVARLRRSRMP